MNSSYQHDFPSSSYIMRIIEKIRSRWDVQISILVFFVTVAGCAWALMETDEETVKVLAAVAWIGWTLIPPIYFLADWAAQPDEMDADALSKFKYSQELASKVWLAGVAVLTGMLVKSGALEGLVG